MLRFTIPIAILVIGAIHCCPHSASAQHAGDIRFHYDAGKIALLPNAGQPATNQSVWSSEWDIDGFFAQQSENPGFISEGVESLGVGPLDILAYDVLDDLLYWDGTTFAEPAEGVHVAVDNNLGAGTFISGDSGVQSGDVASPFVNGIGQATGPGGETAGDLHSHLDFVLEPVAGPRPALGAYGLKLSLITDAVGVSPSDPFLIVFNFGLNELDFAESLEEFASLLSPTLPGDFNEDNMVDAADYAVWRNGYGTEYQIEHYDLWRSHYGQSALTVAPTSAPASVAAPEPMAVAMTVCFVALAALKRQRDSGGPPMK